MKRVISKEAYDALSDAVKALYKQQGDTYILELEDYEDPAELRRARDREKQEAATAKAEATRLATELEAEKGKKARANGDIDALENSWKAKVTTVEQDRDTKLAKKNGWIKNTLIDNVAIQIANELAADSNGAAVLLPHIKMRLTADFDADEPITRVLDKDGKPSAFSVTDLKKEFAEAPIFAAIVKGSKANGAGGAGNHGSGAAKKPSEMSDADRIKLHKENPAEFNRLFPQP